MAQKDDTQQFSSLLLPDPATMGSGSQVKFNLLGKIGFVPGWEGLRGLAVGLVMISHVIPKTEMLGILGVGVFFVLSGFLITGVLMAQIDKQQLANTTIASSQGSIPMMKRFGYLPRFYMDRFMRLTPALIIMVSIASYFGSGRPIIGKDALSAIFYVHNYYPRDLSGKNMMFPGLFLNTWSLAVEEQFYIFWSLVIAFVVPLPVQKRSMVIGALIGASFFVRFYSGYAFVTEYTYGIDYRFAWSSNAFKMFVGCAARLVPMPTFCTRPMTGMISVGTLFTLIFVWLRYDALGYDLRTNGCWLELFTCIVSLTCVTGSIHGNWLLELQVLRFLGRISYSLYLWQFPLHALWGWPSNDWAPTGLAFTVATFTTFTIEEPIRNAYHAWKNSRNPHYERVSDSPEKPADTRRVD